MVQTAKELRLISVQGQEIVLFYRMSRLTPGPTQSIISVLWGVGVQWQGHEADLSSTSSAMVKNSRAVPTLPVCNDVVLN
jgi:hypothetical protein